MDNNQMQQNQQTQAPGQQNNSMVPPMPDSEGTLSPNQTIQRDMTGQGTNIGQAEIGEGVGVYPSNDQMTNPSLNVQEEEDLQAQKQNTFSAAQISAAYVDECLYGIPTESRLQEITIKKVLTNPGVKKMSNNWITKRDELMSKANTRHAGDLSLNLTQYKGDLHSTGRDKKTNIPMPEGETKEIEVGMTEFPAGEDRHKGKGYGDYTMKEMDDNYEEDHQHFTNELYLPITRMRRIELRDYIEGEPDFSEKDNMEQRYASNVVDDLLGMKKATRFDRFKQHVLKAVASKEAAVNESIEMQDKCVRIDGVLAGLGFSDNEIDKLYKTFAKAEYIRGDRQLIKKRAADEGETPLSTPTIEKPVQYKDVKTAPKIDAYTEPEVIPVAGGQTGKAIEAYTKTLTEINDLQTKLAEKLKPLQESIKEIQTPYNTQILEKQATLKTLLEALYDEVGHIEAKVVAYKEDIYASVRREQASAPSASLAEIIKKAEEVAPDIANEIKKIKAMVENDKTSLILEKYVYKYPIAGPQKKKISQGQISTDIPGTVEDESSAQYNDLVQSLHESLSILRHYDDMLTLPTYGLE